MKPKNIAVVYLEPRGKEEKDTFDLVKNILDKNKLVYSLFKREELKKEIFSNKDFVIVIGGDGTFLRTAHFIDKQLVLGVNCSCKVREGFFLKTDVSNFEERFSLILEDKYYIINLNRIKGIINGEETVPVLNEIYVGSEKPYRTSFYKIKIKGKEEIQKSSGVLIATASGSHAWLKSAGGNILDIESKEIWYFVREPYVGKLTKPRLLRGLVKEEEFEIESLMGDGIIVVDSNREYNFLKGKKLRIKQAEPLKLINF